MAKAKDIREAVERKLRDDAHVDATDVAVRNVDGNVALTGTVPSYPQYLEAAAAARRITGVIQVHNHLEVVLSPGDYRDDAALTSAANNALTATTSVPEGVQATAEDGNVVLSGTVRYLSQRSAAEAAVRRLPGVRNVHDTITVAFDVDHAQVKRLVVDALRRHGLPPRAVAVDTRGNTVMLVGLVKTQEQRDAVVGAAWRAPSVMAVVDEIQVPG